MDQRLHEIYRIILGDELLHLLGLLYKHDPQEAIQIAQKAVEKRMGIEPSPTKPKQEDHMRIKGRKKTSKKLK